MSGPADDSSTEPRPIDVSVVMPVFNALPHLDAAIDSILAQTHRNFEFVIFDDGSTDGSAERLRYWASRDDRIRLIHADRNLGPALSSQRVASAATAPIVARMDADDISYPTRLTEQLAVLRQRTDVGVVGSLCDFIDSQGRNLREAEGWRLARRSMFVPFAHGVAMYRREIFDRVGGYRRECEFWEDQDLIARMAAVTPVLVIPHALYQVRLITTSTRVASDQERLERAVDLMYRSVARLEHHRNYEDLLANPPPPGSKVSPRVFVSLGSQILWAGGKPRMFRRLLRRGKLRLDLTTVTSLVWTAWASASPATLRLFLRGLLLVRNSSAFKIHTERPVAWSPGLTISLPSTRAEEFCSVAEGLQNDR